MKSRCVWFWSSCAVLVLLLPLSTLQDLSATERDLYVKLEDALINDPATLEQLREVFLKTPKPTAVYFRVNIIVTSMLSANNCTVIESRESLPVIESRESSPAFCSTSSSGSAVAQWEICSENEINWKTTNPDTSAITKYYAARKVFVWGYVLSLLVATSYTYQYYDALPFLYLYPNDRPTDTTIALSVKELDCHPNGYQLFASLGELFSWIELYTEAGGKPQTWDLSKRAIISTEGYSNHDHYTGAVTYDFSGSILVQISLLLVIPRVFLVYHSKLVEQITSTGSLSLYWGTATVSVLLTITITFYRVLLFTILSPGRLFECTFPIVFLITAIIASRKCKTVPIPAATMNILFYCFSCSPRCNSTAVQALVLWSFMTVIFYHIMEAIALFFALVISVDLTVSFTLMYVSGVFFTIMLVSNIFFTCLSTNVSSRKKKCCFTVADVCVIVFVNTTVGIVFCTYNIMVYTGISQLNLQGVQRLMLYFGVLPSLALTVAGWLYMKNILQKDTQCQTNEEFLLQRADENGEDVSTGDTATGLIHAVNSGPRDTGKEEDANV